MMRNEIIAVDFDGTLCENKFPEIGEPHSGVIAFCIAQKVMGAKLILWTCRTGQDLQAAVDWCKEHSLEFDAVNENLPEHIEAFGGDTRKVFADEYIDDRALRLEAADSVGQWLIKNHLILGV